LGSFALATLLLATAGVYGVMSFSADRRMREFGVRMALGARRRDIVGVVVLDGLKLVSIGVIMGIVVALPLTRLLRAMLFGITANDPVTFLWVSLSLVLVAAAACYVPARRALSIDPMKALARRLMITCKTLLNLRYVEEVSSWFRGGLIVRLKDEKRTELPIARDRVREVKQRLEF
jgi:predicted lysophospholipase L1 biosynthesis ABC-type transport system permease subunit